MGEENIPMAESQFFTKDMNSYQQFSAETKSTQSPISKFVKNSAGGGRNDDIKRYLREPNPNLIHLKSVEQNIQQKEKLKLDEKRRIEQHQEDLIRNSRNYLQTRGLRNRLMSNPTNYSQKYNMLSINKKMNEPSQEERSQFSMTIDHYDQASNFGKNSLPLSPIINTHNTSKDSVESRVNNYVHDCKNCPISHVKVKKILQSVEMPSIKQSIRDLQDRHDQEEINHHCQRIINTVDFFQGVRNEHKQGGI